MEKERVVSNNINLLLILIFLHGSVLAEDKVDVVTTVSVGAVTVDQEYHEVVTVLQGARTIFDDNDSIDHVYKTELQNAFNWKWLREYFTSIYQNVDNPDLNVLQQRQESWQPQ